jgi:hypothetical protein
MLLCLYELMVGLRVMAVKRDWLPKLAICDAIEAASLALITEGQRPSQQSGACWNPRIYAP